MYACCPIFEYAKSRHNNNCNKAAIMNIMMIISSLSFLVFLSMSDLIDN